MGPEILQRGPFFETYNFYELFCILFFHLQTLRSIIFSFINLFLIKRRKQEK